jgi:RNA polymerase sigma-70 factor (ECF subfamily)
MEPAKGIEAAELYQLYLKDVFQYVSRRMPRQEAEDLTLQVFAAALEALPRFRAQCPPRLWLLSIAHRKVVDALRRRASRRETLASELTDPETGAEPITTARASPTEDPEAVLIRSEDRQAIRRLVGQLRRDQREALLLQYVEELSIAEIGLVMGKSPAAVNSLLQRARATLFRWGSDYFLAEKGDGSDE